MLLDIWLIYGAALVVLLALIAVTLLAWRSRSAGKVRGELESRCEAARLALEEGKALLAARTSARDWKQELTARLEALDAEAAGKSDLPMHVAVRRLVLRSELTGDALDLAPHLDQSGGADPQSAAELEALKAAHAALQAELAARRAEPAAGGDPVAAAPASLARERELKALVQQFTRDSREMLTCIQTLESENQALRASAGGTTKPAPKTAAKSAA